METQHGPLKRFLTIALHSLDSPIQAFMIVERQFERQERNKKTSVQFYLDLMCQ